MRKEYGRYQSVRLTRFLLNLSPAVYEVTESLDDARIHLQAIKDAIFSSHLTNKSLRLLEDDDSLTLASIKDRPCLKFYIFHNYNRI